MDADKTAKIQDFIGVTGADEGRARFYLESSAWNLELAMASFYEGDADDDDTAGPPPGPGSGAPSSRAPAGSSRFATISSMGGEESSESDEEGQAFYAGGSERSGQQIIGPKKKGASKNIVDDLFKSARDHGAQEVDKTEEKPKKGPTFKGTGYRLGETDDASDVVHGESVPQGPRQVDKVLKLWQNGFSVDDGPLRDFKDPKNKEFLDSISKGEVPRELTREARGGEVNLNMEDHRHEDYVPPKVSVKAFTGAGHTLGSPAPRVVSSPPQQQTSASRGAGAISIDDTKPTTSLQIRLADGSRLVAKFNHSHKVSDVRQYIVLERPQYSTSNFVLMTTFPNKELTNESQTLEDAKLLNAVIVQRQK